MKLLEQVVSLELAKALKKLEVTQDSIWHWTWVDWNEETEGSHSILAYTFSQNVSAQRSYGYYAEDWWREQEGEVEEEVEVWLECP